MPYCIFVITVIAVIALLYKKNIKFLKFCFTLPFSQFCNCEKGEWFSESRFNGCNDPCHRKCQKSFKSSIFWNFHIIPLQISNNCGKYSTSMSKFGIYGRKNDHNHYSRWHHVGNNYSYRFQFLTLLQTFLKILKIDIFKKFKVPKWSKFRNLAFAAAKMLKIKIPHYTILVSVISIGFSFWLCPPVF